MNGVNGSANARDARRIAELEKYERVYAAMPDYRMRKIRRHDAQADVIHAFNLGARTYLDIGCGRGEMLDFAEGLGFTHAAGVEIVDELCQDPRVIQSFVHDLDHQVADHSVDLASSFDVIEHLIPGDDEILIFNLGRKARHHIVLTANNHRSIDAATGAELHINKRPYDEWDAMIRATLDQSWTVERILDKQYVSATWRATR